MPSGPISSPRSGVHKIFISEKSKASDAKLSLSSDSKTPLSAHGEFWNGFVSNVLGIVATQPLFTLKNCLMARAPLPGIRGLYRGIIPNASSGGPAEGLAFLSIYSCDRLFPRKDNASSASQSLREIGICSLSGLAGAPVNAIFERMMIQQQTQNVPLVKSLGPVIASEGVFRACFKALLPIACRDALFTCGIFAFSDIAERQLEGAIVDKKVRGIVGSVFSGISVGVLTTPFDECATLMQSDYCGRFNSFSRTLVHEAILNNSFKGFALKAGSRAAVIGGLILVVRQVKEIVPSFLPPSLHEEKRS